MTGPEARAIAVPRFFLHGLIKIFYRKFPLKPGISITISIPRCIFSYKETVVDGLKHEELRILQTVESSPSSIENELKLGLEIPHRLLEFGLMRRDGEGRLSLSSRGQHVLFRMRCLEALGDVGAEMGAGVQEWLLESSFIEWHDRGGRAALRVTPRGRLWVASFDSDPTPTAPPASAQHFARRRSA